MKKVLPADLEEITRAVNRRWESYRLRVMLCAGTGCVSIKSLQLRDRLLEELAKHGLQDEVAVIATGCIGFCAVAPVMVVQPEDLFYQSVSEKDVPELVEEHFVSGRPVERLMYRPPGEETPLPRMHDLAFFKKQQVVALRNRGLIDPENIEEAIARGAYRALDKALNSMSPEQLAREVKDSGLRGRGGAGFPTGVKWELTAAQPGDEKYVICNADEGDPGAFMDQGIIESDPHAVLEGMIIGARAMGASQGFVYIRYEYPRALARLGKAVAQARERGLLGTDILGSGFDFDIAIHRGSGAFVCGEETSLISSLEGKPPEPRLRPPFPAESGVNGKPTCINNVETWATVPVIVSRGADWFSKLGTETSKGTKVFALVGKVRNTGLVEVPMGLTLRELVFDIGGGIPGGKKFKAVQTGGPSGGCLPESLLDSPVDYERLAEAGSIMGSGGMIVMDENTCMIDVARYFLNFLRDESCGKCTACREGTDAMYRIVSRICEGEGKEEDLPLLEELGQAVKHGSLCALGGTAPNPVLSTLRYFKNEYEAHIKEGRCPAGVCKALISYSIDPEKCTGCLLCKKNCPQEAISGEKKEAHVLDRSRCIKCGVCHDVCRFDAVVIQ